MGLIDDEIAEIKRCCESQVPHCQVVTAVPAMVRIEIQRTQFKRLAACFMFPNDYPASSIIVELKSKTLAYKLLEGLAGVCEQEAKKHLGKPQILVVVKFVAKFLEDHPLCCCSEEISGLKSLLGPDDSIRLSQKSSSVHITFQKEKYFLKCKLLVPDDYPKQQVDVVCSESNFPRVFKVWFVENSKELARRCVTAPLKPKPNAPKFEPKPSLAVATRFLLESHPFCHVISEREFFRFPLKRLFPEDPSQAIHNERAAAHVERVYCGHAYHHDCLILYMKTPPFEGGKMCPECGKRIYHETWKVTPELAEARWASEQAKARELGDVVDFVRDLNI